MPHPLFSREARAAISRRRGRPERLAPINAASSALLVVDMQNAFVRPDAPLETAASRQIVPAINKLAAGLRDAGGTLVWIGTTLPLPGSLRAWNYISGFVHPDRRQLFLDVLQPGNPDHDFWPELDIADEDIRCYKDRFSPFSPGASDLDVMLRQRGIDTVIIAGTVTNVCCESTARDAMMLNYRVVFAEDANAADSDAAHMATLSSIAEVFGDVADTGEVLAAISQK